MVKNLVVLFTFCDGAIPPALAALKEDETFKEHIPMMTNPNFLKFNNSGIFTKYEKTDGEGLDFTKIFWQLGMANFKTFFKELFPLLEGTSVEMSK